MMTFKRRGARGSLLLRPEACADLVPSRLRTIQLQRHHIIRRKPSEVAAPRIETPLLALLRRDEATIERLIRDGTASLRCCSHRRLPPILFPIYEFIRDKKRRRREGGSHTPATDVRPPATDVRTPATDVRPQPLWPTTTNGLHLHFLERNTPNRYSEVGSRLTAIL